MRRSWSVVVAAILLALAGCASLPEPESPEESLIVGRFVLSFPDGFLGGPPQDINNGVSMVLRDLETGRSRLAYTSDGYYRFVVVGNRRYRFETFAYETQAGGGTRTLGPYPLELEFTADPSTVVFLGELQFTFREPSIVGDREYGGTATRTFDYEIEFEGSVDRELAEAYLDEHGPDSTWASYPIVVPPEL